MKDRVSVLEERIDGLAGALERLEARLRLVEERASAGAVDLGRLTSQPMVTETALPAPLALSGPVALLGRTLLALGGGYLIRSTTELEILPGRLVPLLGLVYAMLFVWLADREASRGRTLSAAFFAITTAALALPLLFEATVRFQLLTPPTAALWLPLVVGS
jgi:hypothetical protein